MLRIELFFICVIVFINKFYVVENFGLPGRFDFELSKKNPIFPIPNRGFYNGTDVEIKINCQGKERVKIGWLLRLSECIDEFYLSTEEISAEIFEKIYDVPSVALHDYNQVKYMKLNLTEVECEETNMIDLYAKDRPPIITVQAKSLKKQTRSLKEQSYNIYNKREVNSTSPPSNQPRFEHKHNEFDVVATTWQDGAYMFIVYTEPVNDKDYLLKTTVSFKYKSGYLSASDWPFLPFYGVMCGIYSLYALFWLFCSWCYWRDLLRLQLWIGGVILLGLMEKAAYLAEYEGINRHGYSVKVAMLVAEIISCFKRSLARILIIIVSLGFGIVKPRLGPTMQKVVGIGGLYFVFALVDGVFRIMDRKEDTDSKGVLAGVPLVFIDVSICYWILSNLQQTMRTLRVRRNIPKLTLYRHFTNTLIFCVIASVIFMIWSLSRHRFVNCLKDWKELWLDEGFWHILFSFILLVIIILWRPSNNSQRFAFTPLLDNEEDLDDIDDQENEVFDSIKMRSNNTKSTKETTNAQQNQKSSIEDDLKWVEENVPATLTEAAMPGLVDSEEEIMTTRFEMSKMD